MGLLQKTWNILSLRNRSVVSIYFRPSRYITTTPGGKESNFVGVDAEAKKIIPKKKIRNWMSYGFDIVNQKNDLVLLHLTSFCWIVVIAWGGIFTISYFPDFLDFHWLAREAYIELRKREVLGLPLVDPNYYDPDTIILPPDEELGEDDIVI